MPERGGTAVEELPPPGDAKKANQFKPGQDPRRGPGRPRGTVRQGPAAPSQLRDMQFVYRRAEKQDRSTAQKAMRQFLKTRPAEFVKTMAGLEEEHRKVVEEWKEKQAAAAVVDVPGGVGVAEEALRKVIDGLMAKWGEQ